MKRIRSITASAVAILTGSLVLSSCSTTDGDINPSPDSSTAPITSEAPTTQPTPEVSVSPEDLPSDEAEYIETVWGIDLDTQVHGLDSVREVYGDATDDLTIDLFQALHYGLNLNNLLSIEHTEEEFTLTLEGLYDYVTPEMWERTKDAKNVTEAEWITGVNEDGTYGTYNGVTYTAEDAMLWTSASDVNFEVYYGEDHDTGVIATFSVKGYAPATPEDIYAYRNYTVLLKNYEEGWLVDDYVWEGEGTTANGETQLWGGE